MVRVLGRGLGTLSLVISLMGSVLLAGETGLVRSATPVRSSEYKVGERIADIRFVDSQGVVGNLSEYRKYKATVVFMYKVGYPLSQKYSPTIQTIAKNFAHANVGFLIVNAGIDSPEVFKAALVDYGLTLRSIPDGREWTTALGARASTDTFVLDSSQTLVARGPIDDQHRLGYSLPQPQHHFLLDALTAVLAEAVVIAPAWLGPVGPGSAVEASAAPVEAPKPTYHNRISRIIQTQCQSCHRPGGGTPFSLMTYQETRRQMRKIAAVLEEGAMPPWFANPHVGEWENDARLTDRDRNSFLEWIAEGGPEGEASEGPKPIQWTTGWKIGQPDHIVPVPNTYPIPAAGVIPYQYVVVPTGLREDKWVEKVEIHPSDPSVVHHILIFLVYPPGHPKQVDPRRGVHGFFAGYVPGQSHQILSKGLGLFLPKEAHLLFQIHYQPNGKPTRDRPSVGLVFSKKKPDFEVQMGAAADLQFQIPPQVANFSVSAEAALMKPSRILSFFPHMHLRGKAFQIEAIFPNGTRKIILDVPKFVFDWQLEYRLRTPLDVPAGTRLVATGLFDNSANNPANPNPNVAVGFGEPTDAEMMIGYFRYHEL
jgi:AhpC/TSA family